MDAGILPDLKTGIEVMQHLVAIDGLRMFGLPDKIRGDGIGGSVDGVRQCHRAAEGTVVVIPHPCASDDDDEQRENRAPGENGRMGAIFPEKDPMQKGDGDREAQQQTFIGPGDTEKRDAGSQQQAVANACGFHEARQGSEYQRSSQCGDQGSAGVGVDPIAEEAETQHGEDSAEQRPTGRQPCLQHPADGSAHEGAAEEHGKPWISEEDFSRGQKQALTGKIHGHVGGLHGDVEALEVSPHGWRGVCQAAMRESIGREQETEIVWHKG